jgi:hypothetical protein
MILQHGLLKADANIIIAKEKARRRQTRDRSGR